MPTCDKCHRQFPNHVRLYGKERNLQNRKFCLKCSPFGKHNTRSFIEKTHECRVCGEQSLAKMMRNGKSGTSKSICKSCHSKNTILRGKANRKLYIQYKGSKCSKCGYSKCDDALDFHHPDPHAKDTSFRSWRYWGLEKAKVELDKCILLCANCHREEHASDNGSVVQ